MIIDYLCGVTGGSLACATDADDARWVAIAEVRQYGVAAKAADVIMKAVALAQADS